MLDALLQITVLPAVGFALMALCVISAGPAFAYAVFADARALGSGHPYVWGVGSAAFVPIFLVYVVLRHRWGPRGPPSDGERIARTAAAAVLVPLLVAATFTPPDPYVQILWFWGSLVVAAPVSYYLFYRE